MPHLHKLALHACHLRMLAFHALPALPSLLPSLLSSSLYPLPKARCPDEPAKSVGEVWVVGSDGKKKVGQMDQNKGVVGGIKERWS